MFRARNVSSEIGFSHLVSRRFPAVSAWPPTRVLSRNPGFLLGLWDVRGMLGFPGFLRKWTGFPGFLKKIQLISIKWIKSNFFCKIYCKIKIFFWKKCQKCQKMTVRWCFFAQKRTGFPGYLKKITGFPGFFENMATRDVAGFFSGRTWDRVPKSRGNTAQWTMETAAVFFLIHACYYFYKKYLFSLDSWLRVLHYIIKLCSSYELSDFLCIH